MLKFSDDLIADIEESILKKLAESDDLGELTTEYRVALSFNQKIKNAIAKGILAEQKLEELNNG